MEAIDVVGGHIMHTEARVDSFGSLRDAELAKAYLASYDIDVRLEGEVLNGVGFRSGPILNGVELYVDEQDGEQARQLLAGYQTQIQKKRMASSESPDHLVTRACIAALIGYVTIPLVFHAYSVWLLLHLDRATISAEKRYRFTVAWAADLAAFGLLALWAFL